MGVKRILMFDVRSYEEELTIIREKIDMLGGEKTSNDWIATWESFQKTTESLYLNH